MPTVWEDYSQRLIHYLMQIQSNYLTASLSASSNYKSILVHECSLSWAARILVGKSLCYGLIYIRCYKNETGYPCSTLRTEQRGTSFILIGCRNETGPHSNRRRNYLYARNLWQAETITQMLLSSMYCSLCIILHVPKSGSGDSFRIFAKDSKNSGIL